MKSDNNVDIFFLGDTYFGELHMRLRARKSKHDILKEKGYVIARRTVAKYRERMNIPIARLRKEI